MRGGFVSHLRDVRPECFEAQPNATQLTHMHRETVVITKECIVLEFKSKCLLEDQKVIERDNINELSNCQFFFQS